MLVHPEGWRPLLRGILDPPLHTKQKWERKRKIQTKKRKTSNKISAFTFAFAWSEYRFNRMYHIFLFLRNEQDIVFGTDVVGDVADADALEIVAELIVPVSVTRRVGIHRQPVLASL